MGGLTGWATEIVLETERILAIAGRQRGMLAGSMYTSRTRCGRKACKCMASDYRHENCCLSFCEDGKSRTRTVPQELIQSIREQTDAYREAKAHRREIARLSKGLLLAVDRIIDREASRGQKELLASISQIKGGAR